MKNLIIFLLLAVIAYGTWHVLTQPIGSAEVAESVAAEPLKNTKKASEKPNLSKEERPLKNSNTSQEASVNSTSENPKSTPAVNTKGAARLTHYYDYGTNSNLKIQAIDSRNLAKQMSKKPKKYQYRGKRAPKNWETDFYNLFLNAPEDETVLVDMAEQLQRQAKKLGVTAVELAIAYVQGGIEYDDQKASYNEFLLNYPYETIYSRKGVCADKTILLSKLLTLMDYKHVLFEFPKVQHMALGLKVPSKYGNFNTGYAFVETTSYATIGQIPENYIQGIRIKEKPTLIFPRQNGKRTFIQMGDYAKKQGKLASEYGDAFKYGTTRQKQIAVEMKDLEKKMNKLEAEHDRRKCAKNNVKSEAEFQTCKKLTADINKMVDEYNSLRKAFNKAADR